MSIADWERERERERPKGVRKQPHIYHFSLLDNILLRHRSIKYEQSVIIYSAAAGKRTIVNEWQFNKRKKVTQVTNDNPVIIYTHILTYVVSFSWKDGTQYSCLKKSAGFAPGKWALGGKIQNSDGHVFTHTYNTQTMNITHTFNTTTSQFMKWYGMNDTNFVSDLYSKIP